MKQLKYLKASLLILTTIACSSIVNTTNIASTDSSSGEVDATAVGTPATLAQNAPSPSPTTQSFLDEVEVIPLKIPERIESASFEYSGMGWYGENLVLLPQFPQGKDFSRTPNLFAITKNDLLQVVENPDLELPVRNVSIINSDLRKLIKGFEGFESILFVGQTVYLTIESRAGNPMMGYLIKGDVKGEFESITLDPESLVALEPFSSERNATFEAMTSWNDKLYVIYEHNSGQNGQQPVAYEFNFDLELEREIPFPAINFRVTDATISDKDGKFWVMNYFFPGDTHLAVDEDFLALEYGEGETHAENEPVERLLQLQVGDIEITRVDQAPIYLQLLNDNVARNWEGIVLLDDLGFLMVTDSFPGSILGFCPVLR